MKWFIVVVFIIAVFLSGCLEASDNKDGTQDIYNNTNNTVQQATPTPTHTQTPLPTPRQSIAIRTSATWMAQPPWDKTIPGEYYGKSALGREENVIPLKNDKPFYIIITFEITNNGYDELKIYPAYLSIVYEKAKYAPIKGSALLEDVLPESDLLNTGTIKGSLLYYIPSYAGHKNYEVLFDDRRHNYNIDYTFKSQ